MGELTIDSGKLNEVIRLVGKRYEGWESFEHPEFQKDEVIYKRNASEKAQSLLSERTLTELLDENDYTEFIRRVREVGNSTNLMYLSHPSSGDMNLINLPELNEEAFCTEFFALLYDSEPVGVRLSRFFEYVDRQGISPKWTFPTYFLFLCYPESEMFIKPMMTRWFVELMNGPKSYPWTPSGEGYEAMQAMYQQLKETLDEYGPQDMIDIHSLVFTAYWESEKAEKLELAEPFDRMFADMDEANWAFDLMADMAERLGYEDSADPRFAMTLAPGYLRLSFGNWVMLDFPPDLVGMTLLDEKVPVSLNLKGGEEFANSERPARFYKIPRQMAQPFTETLEAAYEESCAYIAERFKNWGGTPFRHAHLPEVFEALFDIDRREILLTEGFQKGSAAPERETHYWRITLPEEHELSGEAGPVKTSIWDLCLEHDIAAIDFGEDMTNHQVQKFISIQPGDWIVAFLRDRRIGGIGEVTAGFDEQLLNEKPIMQNYWHGNFWIRLNVDWTPVSIDADRLPKATANKFYGMTVMELTEDDFQAVKQLAESAEKYDEAMFLAETHLLADQLAEMLDMLNEKQQLIFYGPPGTGKTFVAKALAKLKTGLAHPSSERVETVQFHPAFGYEDFIEGIRPVSKQLEDGRYLVDYPPKAGIFRRFCERAAKDLNRPYVFIIDEINRGNIPRIFGELMLLLEYRNEKVRLPYSGEEFSIPPNVYLIGTMNTADRSIALVDFGLRRRFHFFQFNADPELYRRWLAKNPTNVPYLGELFKCLTNEAIGDPAFQIGHSYFMDPEMTEEKLVRIWRRSVVPYLVEYFMGQEQKADNWRWKGKRVQEIVNGSMT